MEKKEEKNKAKERLNELLLIKDDFVETYAAELMKEDGKAHIEVDLCHGAEVFDSFSSHRDLSPTLFAYVESSVKYLRVSVPLSIDFALDPAKSLDQERIKKEFKGNYRFDFDEARHEIFRCNRQIIWLYVVGIVFIALTSVFTGLSHQYSSTDPLASTYFDVASQVLSIASWVFIWDAVDKQAFEKRDLKKKLLRSAQLCASEITFITPDKGGKAA
jgi:hypothetical protein